KTLKSTAEDCGISVPTAFFWRHKILDALNKTSEKVYLTGTVEADETYLPVSYKGNHSKSSHFTMPRPAHKRGRDIHTSGLSFDQACVLCAVDREGIPVSGIGKTGKVSSECVKKMFTGRFGPDITLCTDHEKAYGRFSNDQDLQWIRMDADQRTDGIYGIQRINAYHSKLKGFLRSCHGVSTKYLQNYLTWHNLMFCTLRKRKEQEAILWAAVLTEKVMTKCKEISRRDPVPVLQPV
ncbi:MAG: IS1595 family transposase, partial [Lachnospiraceae bacterium]|nr:IS1595 family transposase [Lachnospiraceae bacterium]